jgi:hypothetical protein
MAHPHAVLADALPAHKTAVVELFTSQGCSSCPPADRLLASLAHNPGMIALTFSVDYWDYIGWKDTLASPQFTARQKAYAAVRKNGRVYTPQAVVNGEIDVVGSDEDGIKQAIDTHTGQDTALSVPMQLEEKNGVLHIKIASVAGRASNRVASVVVLRVEAHSTVAIRRGENKGQSLTYTNVVRAMREIGEWRGDAADFEVRELTGENEGYVVLLQEGTTDKPGTILAAAKSPGF